MLHKRKKNTRQRGTHTHGWGSKKKHRGAGNRGGRGKAGSGKRGDAKKPSFWGDKSNFKQRGFTSLKKALVAINIEKLSKFADTKINLTKEGFDKLLGMGTPDRKYQITVKYASKLAIEKIQKAGGSVSVLEGEKETTISEKEVKSSEETESKEE